VAEFFDVAQTRKLAWACRPQSAALVTQLADPDREWDAVVTGEYERAFYGSQYAAMAPLFEHYGVQLWTPEVDGRVDYQSEHDEKTMTILGLSSKREITRTSIRVRTADDLRSLAPVGDGADRHAQVLRVGLVGHAQSLPERIGLAARPSRDHLHAHLPSECGVRINNLHCGCTAYALRLHGPARIALKVQRDCIRASWEASRIPGAITAMKRKWPRWRGRAGPARTTTAGNPSNRSPILRLAFQHASTSAFPLPALTVADRRVIPHRDGT